MVQTRDFYIIDSLQRSLRTMGYTPHFYTETESTILIIEQIAREGRRDRFLAIADHQTQGMGREGRVWYDIQGCSLLFTVLLYLSETTIAAYADLAAITLCALLRKIIKSEAIKIKYPNDLVIDDKKLGGILVKNMYDERHHYQGTNVSVGLNVHYTEAMMKQFTTDYPMTSLDIAANRFIKRQELLLDIANALRYLDTEVEVIASNPHARSIYQTQWEEMSSLLGRKVVILQHDILVQQGKVIATQIGKGIQIQSAQKREWFSLFGSAMKVRLL